MSKFSFRTCFIPIRYWIDHPSQLTKAVYTGALSGLFLGLYFKVIEGLTQIKVYTLLLNVDYIPFLKTLHLTEYEAFMFHLFLSILISATLIKLLHSKNGSKKKIIPLSLGLSLIIGLIAYPTTLFSEHTPSITSSSAQFIWLSGHILYGVFLGYLLKK